MNHFERMFFMKLFTRDFNRTSSFWTAILFYFICGLLLLLFPNLALNIANFALAAVLCIVGIFCIIGYLRGSVLDGVMGMELAMGLVLLCFGLLLLINPTFLSALLPFLWGVSLLVGGFSKIQLGADLKRIGESRWWAVLIAALVSFLLGIVSITKPTFIASISVQFIGISLIVEAALDLATFLVINKKIKDFRKAVGSMTIEQ